jgi:hypothetical protein
MISPCVVAYMISNPEVSCTSACPSALISVQTNDTRISITYYNVFERKTKVVEPVSSQIPKESVIHATIHRAWS